MSAAGLALLGLLVVGVWAIQIPATESDTSPRDVAPAPNPLDGIERASAVDLAPQLGIARTIRSWDAAIADVQGDGRPDLLIGRHAEAAPLQFLSKVAGGFDEVASPLPGGVDRHACAWADVDSNGLLDVYCVGGADRGTAQIKANELWLQREGGSFVESGSAYGVTDPYGRGRWPLFVDVDQDGLVDLFVSNASERSDDKTSPNRLFMNTGDGAFRSAPEFGLDLEMGGACASTADFNADGWVDLLVCGNVNADDGGLRLFRNDSGSGFSDVTRAVGIKGNAQDAFLADMDQDGDPDLVRVQQASVSVQVQDAGTFGAQSVVRGLPERVGRSVEAGDVNGDGRVDMYVVQGCADNNSRPPNAPDLLLINEGGLSFSEAALPPLTDGCGDWAFVVDHDVDGRDEFLVLNGCCEGPEGFPVGPIQLLSVPTAEIPTPEPA